MKNSASEYSIVQYLKQISLERPMVQSEEKFQLNWSCMPNETKEIHKKVVHSTLEYNN